MKKIIYIIKNNNKIYKLSIYKEIIFGFSIRTSVEGSY